MKRENRPDPTERMSARQLRELLLAERAQVHVSATAKVRRENEELRRALERADARAKAVVNELAAAREEATSEGIEGDRVAGKPAVADVRRAWRKFTSAVLRMPQVCRAEGFDAMALQVSQEIIPTLYQFSLWAARGPHEAQEQDAIRRQFETTAFLAILSRSEPWTDAHRRRLLARAARCYLRPTLWLVYEKASDASLNRDMLGTVYK